MEPNHPANSVDSESKPGTSPLGSTISTILEKQAKEVFLSDSANTQYEEKEAEILLRKVALDAELEVLQQSKNIVAIKAELLPDGNITQLDQPPNSNHVHCTDHIIILENQTDAIEYMACSPEDLVPFHSLTQPSPTPPKKWAKTNEEGRQFWSHDAVLALVEMRGKHVSLFSNNAVSMKQAWRKVSEDMHQLGHIYSAPDCDKKFRNLKLRYKLTRKKQKRTDSCRWRFFDVMDDLMQGKLLETQTEGDHPYNRTLSPRIVQTVSLASDVISTNTDYTVYRSQKDPEVRHFWSHDAVVGLVEMRGKHASLFSNNAVSMKQAWRKVSEDMHQLGHIYSPPDCDKKFRNLKLRYKQNRKNQKKKGAAKWRYFDIMDEVMRGADSAVETAATVGNEVEASAGHSNKRSLSPSTYSTENSLLNPAEDSPPKSLPARKKARTIVTDSELPELRQDLLRMHGERMKLEVRRVEALERLVTILEQKL